MAEFPLKQAVNGKDVKIVWMPFELRSYPAPTLRPEESYLRTAWKNSVYPLAARMGVEIRLPSVSPQPYTRLAFEGLEFAKDHALGDEYNSGVMRAFFQRSEDIGNPEVLANVASSVGLDTGAFAKALEQRGYAERVAGLLRNANEQVQVTGVPLFLVGNERLSGVQSQPTLESVIERALEDNRD
ncbi:MAG: DsbA family oxidoreductase [Bryobacteraceae bacterium]